MSRSDNASLFKSLITSRQVTRNELFKSKVVDKRCFVDRQCISIVLFQSSEETASDHVLSMIKCIKIMCIQSDVKIGTDYARNKHGHRFRQFKYSSVW